MRQFVVVNQGVSQSSPFWKRRFCLFVTCALIKSSSVLCQKRPLMSKFANRRNLKMIFFHQFCYTLQFYYEKFISDKWISSLKKLYLKRNERMIIRWCHFWQNYARIKLKRLHPKCNENSRGSFSDHSKSLCYLLELTSMNKTIVILQIVIFLIKCYIWN